MLSKYKYQKMPNPHIWRMQANPAKSMTYLFLGTFEHLFMNLVPNKSSDSRNNTIEFDTKTSFRNSWCTCIFYILVVWTLGIYLGTPVSQRYIGKHIYIYTHLYIYMGTCICIHVCVYACVNLITTQEVFWKGMKTFVSEMVLTCV